MEKHIKVNGNPHGYGELDWGNGFSFEGYFKDGLQDGVWRKYYNKEYLYSEHWENGQLKERVSHADKQSPKP